MTDTPDVQRFAPADPRERIRPDRMCVVEIESAVVGKVISPGHLVNEGVGRYEVYERDLPELFRLVADPVQEGDTVRTDPAKLDAAKQKLRDDRAAFLAKQREYAATEDDPTGKDHVKWSHVAHLFPGARNWVEQYGQMYELSTEAPSKGIPPFRRVTVVERGLPPPQSEAARHAAIQTQGQTEAMAEAFAMALRSLGIGDEKPKRRKRGNDTDEG